MILLSSLIAFCVNVSIFMVIGKTSAITYNVLGHSKTCSIFLIGFLFFKQQFSWLNFSGIITTLWGLLIGLFSLNTFAYHKVRCLLVYQAEIGVFQFFFWKGLNIKLSTLIDTVSRYYFPLLIRSIGSKSALKCWIVFRLITGECLASFLLPFLLLGQQPTRYVSGTNFVWVVVSEKTPKTRGFWQWHHRKTVNLPAEKD